jgi:hypothetical protein
VKIPAVENSFSTPDIPKAIADLFLDAFVDFVARVHADGWRIKITNHIDGGWTALITAPDEIPSSHTIPSAPNFAMRFAIRLDEQHTEWMKRRADGRISADSSRSLN